MGDSPAAAWHASIIAPPRARHHTVVRRAKPDEIVLIVKGDEPRGSCPPLGKLTAGTSGLSAPAERRDSFVSPTSGRLKPHQFVVIVKGREPGRS